MRKIETRSTAAPSYMVPLVWVILCSVMLVGCEPSKKEVESGSFQPKEITVKGNRFVDDSERQVILNSINLVNKSKKDGYMLKGGPELYAKVKEWGFNSIRLVIIWDGLEPEPGTYNEEYLKEIDKRIKWAQENGLFVVLDMHQDLFSVKYADGAPEWATLDEGLPHVKGDVWSDAYMMSPAVQTAFDNFWANKKASDSLGVQDHYANVWKHVAKRYANNPTVIGYDLMNEPSQGSSLLQAKPALLKALGKMLNKLEGTVMTEKQLTETWNNVEQRMAVLKLLSNKENYAEVIDALYPYTHAFEKEKLQPFYQRVANAIREVDTDHVLFLEHAYYGNKGVKSSIERTTLPNGVPDPLVSYGAHPYDLVTDTKSAANASVERVDLIYDRIVEKGQQLKMPVWLGEWGAYYDWGESIVTVARHAISRMEKDLLGNAYWSYHSSLESQAYFKKAIIRPYPAYTNGELLGYKFDFDNSILSVEWRENGANDAPTVIFIPWLSKLQLDNQNDVFSIEKIEGSDAGWILISTQKEKGIRKIDFYFKK
ncbi:cellulase family glycosylhydrolase [Flavobacteriaceae bacterium F89]|uniref:Cellulase family glycosylhydrolase n=1 Tax=Cerina litoralis TaxID=2874477 RepID=A0AAE3EW81_9FLAO|nr:cellulase family glycosylhydrolase [Cerina litoralis]MCG2461494.1 cellulase family glycosylhydrolase [Cerina litoralis]